MNSFTHECCIHNSTFDFIYQINSQNLHIYKYMNSSYMTSYIVDYIIFQVPDVLEFQPRAVGLAAVIGPLAWEPTDGAGLLQGFKFRSLAIACQQIEPVNSIQYCSNLKDKQSHPCYPQANPAVMTVMVSQLATGTQTGSFFKTVMSDSDSCILLMIFCMYATNFFCGSSLLVETFKFKELNNKLLEQNKKRLTSR